MNYKNVNDLATLWCEYAEMELRHNSYQRALDIMARATTPPRNPNVNFRDEVCFIKFRRLKHVKSFNNPRNFYFFFVVTFRTTQSIQVSHALVILR